MKALLAALALLALAACATAPEGVADAGELQAMRERPERMVVVAVANPRVAGSVVAGSTSTGYASMQPYLAGGHARRAIEALKQAHGLREVAAWPIRALRVHCVVFELPAGAQREQTMQALARDARVDIVQALQDFGGLSQGATYNDPYAALQRALFETEVPQAHLRSRGAGVGIAIVDTGADAAHPDLQGRIASVHNFVDRDTAQFGRDRHGTEVAGVIAAVANNRLGVVGIAPEATLRIYKACWHAENGSARCNSFTLALALAASLDHDARILNLSLAGPRDELLARLLQQAISRGRIVVAAVPPDGSLDGFPLGVPGVIAADAPGRPARRGVHVAPGRDVLTTVPGGHYDFGSGSSLAAAHVSGVIALLLAASDAPPPAASVRAALDSASAGPPRSINACRALLALQHAPLACLDAPR